MKLNALFVGTIIITTLLPGILQATDCNRPGNLVGNCDFTADLAGWVNIASGTSVHITDDGDEALGSAELDPIDPMGPIEGDVIIGTELRTTGCVPFSASTAGGWGMAARLVSGATDVMCTPRVWLYSDAACGTFEGSIESPQALINPVVTSWQSAFEGAGFTTTSTTQSVQFSLLCWSLSSNVPLSSLARSCPKSPKGTAGFPRGKRAVFR